MCAVLDTHQISSLPVHSADRESGYSTGRGATVRWRRIIGRFICTTHTSIDWRRPAHCSWHMLCGFSASTDNETGRQENRDCRQCDNCGRHPSWAQKRHYRRYPRPHGTDTVDTTTRHGRTRDLCPSQRCALRALPTNVT